MTSRRGSHRTKCALLKLCLVCTYTVNGLQAGIRFSMSIFFPIDFHGQESIAHLNIEKILPGSEGRKAGTGKNPRLHPVNGFILSLGMEEVTKTSQLMEFYVDRSSTGPVLFTPLPSLTCVLV